MSHLSTIHKSEINVLSSKKEIELFIAGIGAVGSTLVCQITELTHPGLQFRVIGACNSKGVEWNPDISRIATKPQLKPDAPTHWDELTEELIKHSNGNLIFVDATGSAEVARQYSKLMKHGVSVVTPSKRANTFEQVYFDELQTLNAEHTAYYRFETTVGAGLPVITTLNQLLESGDEITKITGVVSGTMTYLFNQIELNKPFSSIIEAAKKEGYSEPDPRDDLSGEDVARKFLIMARTCGFTFERDDIRVDTLVPEDLIDLSLSDFMERISDYDGHWASRNALVLVNNTRLRYVGTFTPEGIHVGVQEVPAHSVLGALSGTDNLIEIHTKRYSESPIVIQGPGAGRSVTAAGVLSDIVDIGKQLG
ncbi:MAG: hypothetical protein AAFW89_10925 [Bacteroidota bacterium]